LRAFRVYFDVLATADWFRTEMRGQLDTFDLTMMDFRALELLLREGPTHIRGRRGSCRCFRRISGW
jgi:hypothetical protein